MTDKSLAIRNNSGLQNYGDREAIREMTERLKMTLPGGRKLDDLEARSLAQLSLAHGLDPFNGEAWMIPGTGLMVGIKGLRKSARAAARAEGGAFWTEFRRVDPAEHGAPANAVVFECILRDTVTVQAWSKSVNLMTSAGLSYADAVAAIGPPPVVVGVGIATPDERSRLAIQARARKRAEADAIKQRYDVAFGNAQFSAEEPEDADLLEGAVVDFDERPGRTEAEILEEMGYDPADPASPDPAEPAIAKSVARPYPPNILAEKLDEASMEYAGREASRAQRGLVASLIEGAFGGPEAEQSRHAVLKFLFGRESLRDIPDSLILAMLDRWLKPVRKENRYAPDATAVDELRMAYEAAIQAQGQLSLDI